MLFVEILDSLPGSTAGQFTQSVKDLFDEKLVSPEGAYAEYMVTTKDLMSIAKEYANKGN